MTWIVKTYYVELDFRESLELERKNWDTAQGEGGERVVSLASSITHIWERRVSMLGNVLEHVILFADVRPAQLYSSYTDAYPLLLFT